MDTITLIKITERIMKSEKFVGRYQLYYFDNELEITTSNGQVLIKFKDTIIANLNHSVQKREHDSILLAIKTRENKQLVKVLELL